MKPNNITLTLKNNTNAIQSLVLMGGMANFNQNANATTRYQYDVTGDTFDVPTISIQVKGVGQSEFQTYEVELLENSLAGVIAALNSLSFGTWYSEVVGDDTFIVIYHDQLVFGELTISATANNVIILDVSDTEYAELILRFSTPTHFIVDWGDGTSDEQTSDEAFLIKEYIGGSSARTITVTIVSPENLTEFSVLSTPVKWYSDLTAFTNMAFMKIQSHSLSPELCGQLPSNMEYLAFDDCQLTELPPLPASVDYLSIGFNLFDSSILASLAGVRTVYLGGNPNITSIENVHSSVEELDVSDCAVSSITSLSNNLSRLLAANNNLEGIINLPPAPALQSLLLSNNNGITQITNLPASLEELYVGSCSSLESITGLPEGFRILDAASSGSLITLDEELPDSLTSLVLNGTGITSLPDMDNTQLEILVISNTPIASIGLLPSTVTTINATQTNLTEFTPISHCIGLTTMRLENNSSLVNFNYALPTSLEQLHLFACENLETCPPSFHEGMTAIYLYGGSLASIPAIPSTVATLWIYDNPLTTVPDISNASSLQSFEIGQTQLITSFDPELLAPCIGTLNHLLWNGGKLDQASVSGILEYFDANSLLVGLLDLRQNPSVVPDAGGLAAKASLQGKGWTVQTDV